MVAKARRMTVLLLVALGFLAVLAYVALGFTHVVFERLAQKQDRRVSGGRR